MGNVTVSTSRTQIYYPSDWLIDGGPTFESMGCPEPKVGAWDVDTLKLIYNKDTRYFGIVHNGAIVMESTDRLDIADYVKDYVEKFQMFVQEQDQINDEADADND